MMRLGAKRRLGISPVLATVILIAVTLIAAVAISGFVFGLMGTFTSTAVVSASSGGACSGTPESCVLTLVNSGAGSVGLTGSCKLNFAGGYYLGTAALLSGSLNAGRTASVSCTSNSAGSHAPVGTQVTGSVAIGNGAQVLFAAPAG